MKPYCRMKPRRERQNIMLKLLRTEAQVPAAWLTAAFFVLFGGGTLKAAAGSTALTLVLFGTGYWDEVVNFEALIRHGTIDRKDLRLFHRTDSVDEAFDIVTRELVERALPQPGAIL